MIRINLLPPQERRQRPHRYLAFAAGAVVAVCLLTFLVQSYQLWRVERQLQDVRTQMELLRPTVEKMQQANEKIEIINAKNKLLTDLTGSRISWYAVAARLSVAIPANVWLTDLEPVDKSTVRIKGATSAYPALSLLLQQLSRDFLLTDPVLVSAESDPSQSITKFEITVKLKGM